MTIVIYMAWNKGRWKKVQQISIKDEWLINYSALELIRSQIEQKVKGKVKMTICEDE